MSALLAPLEEVAERGSTRAPRPPLRPVAPSPLRLSRVGFIIFVITLLGAGMVGVLLLNTSIQQRAQTVVAAQRTAEDLGTSRPRCRRGWSSCAPAPTWPTGPGPWAFAPTRTRSSCGWMPMALAGRWSVSRCESRAWRCLTRSSAAPTR